MLPWQLIASGWVLLELQPDGAFAFARRQVVREHRER